MIRSKQMDGHSVILSIVLTTLRARPQGSDLGGVQELGTKELATFQLGIFALRSRCSKRKKSPGIMVDGDVVH